MSELELVINDICKKLQSVERSDRQNGLNLLKNICNEENVKNILKIYDGCYLYILKCYSDKFESCRQLASNVVTEYIMRLPKNDFYLENVVSTIAARIGKKEIIETSEEVRLVFLQQIIFLIETFRVQNDNEKDLLLTSFLDIVDILLKTLTDPYPDIQKEACNCIVIFAEATPLFDHKADDLAKPIFPLLNHKHAKVRQNAITALGSIAMHLVNKGDCLVRIITEISPLLMDSNPSVRQEVGIVGCKMILDHKDRYSYFERLIPLPLSCLIDDSPQIQNEIKSRWLDCGVRYYEENEAELSKLEVTDSLPKNYPSGVERPTIGCRGIVQRCLRVIKLITRESYDWKENVRVHSLKLLFTFILHTEGSITAFFFEIYPDIAKSCTDIKIVAKEAIKVSDILGRLLVYEEWKQHAIDGLKDHPKLSYLKCFYYMFVGSNSMNINDIQSISEILCNNAFLRSLNEETEDYLLKWVNILWDRYNSQENKTLILDKPLYPESEKDINVILYHITIQVIAMSYNDNFENDIVKCGKDTLVKLAKEKSENVGMLHEKYLNPVFESLDCLDSELDDTAEPIILLYGLIRVCEFRSTYLISLKKCIKTVWKYGLPTAKIKIFSAISIAMLNWNTSMHLDLNESVKHLKAFIDDIVSDHLVWKAGSTAESMRSFATSTLCVISQSVPNEAPLVLPNYAKYFVNLMEDNLITTRKYAIQCFVNFGVLPIDVLLPIAYAILKRFDDASHKIREIAAKVICHLEPLNLGEHDEDSWIYFIKKAFQMLFIYFEGPELRLKEIIKESLITLGKRHPIIFKEALNETMAAAGDRTELEELKRAIP